ncbi:MAG: hypothetical protein V1724_08875 [Chloroflexota bacterium]
MPLFSTERKRKGKDLEREVRFKQGISRVHRYVEKCEASRQHVWSQAKRGPGLGCPKDGGKTYTTAVRCFQ